jgi:thiosulfate reductase/polysulfide reductase chain A
MKGMMTQSILSRRDFLKLGSASLGALATAQFIPPRAAEAAKLYSLDANGDGYVPTTCEMCVWRCGVRARIDEGRIVKLEGNPEHPHSRGKLCARGQSGLMNTYDPDRVLTPLVRAGKRGEGLFRKASWDEALDLVAQNMLKIKEQYGPEAMSSPSPTTCPRYSSREPAQRIRLAQLRDTAQPVLLTP